MIHGLYGQIESGLDGIEDTLGDGVLLVDLDRLIEELRVQVFDLLQGHVVLFHERHDLFAGDEAPLLAYPHKVLNVRQGAHVLLHIDCGHLTLP